MCHEVERKHIVDVIYPQQCAPRDKGYRVVRESEWKQCLSMKMLSGQGHVLSTSPRGDPNENNIPTSILSEHFITQKLV